MSSTGNPSVPSTHGCKPHSPSSRISCDDGAPESFLQIGLCRKMKTPDHRAQRFVFGQKRTHEQLRGIRQQFFPIGYLSVFQQAQIPLVVKQQRSKVQDCSQSRPRWQICDLDCWFFLSTSLCTADVQVFFTPTPPCCCAKFLTMIPSVCDDRFSASSKAGSRFEDLFR